MEHSGVHYQILRTTHPSGWRWVVELPGKKARSGVVHDRTVAVLRAESVIEKILKVQQEPLSGR